MKYLILISLFVFALVSTTLGISLIEKADSIQRMKAWEYNRINRIDRLVEQACR